MDELYCDICKAAVQHGDTMAMHIQRGKHRTQLKKLEHLKKKDARSVFVARFVQGDTDNDLRRYFGQFGHVNNYYINREKAFAIIEYAEQEVADYVVAQKKHLLGRSRLVVFPKKDRSAPQKQDDKSEDKATNENTDTTTQGDCVTVPVNQNKETEVSTPVSPDKRSSDQKKITILVNPQRRAIVASATNRESSNQTPVVRDSDQRSYKQSVKTQAAPRPSYNCVPPPDCLKPPPRRPYRRRQPPTVANKPADKEETKVDNLAASLDSMSLAEQPASSEQTVN